MKFAVYILYSPKKKNLYIGQTSNLYKRLGSHFAGKVKTTKNRLPLILILQEYYRNRSEASKRERFLKSLWGVREKKRILAEYLKKRQKVV
ncbi:MAG: GIY-YIG nuclease family protein [Candidatus Colwellbacteria bacterium]|nr:GIY-YIG nuclease family protein [Candidatus Colwellbacteria bacterium]